MFFFRENNIDPEQIKLKDYLIEAIKSFDIKKKIEILQTAEKLERQKTEKRKEAESVVTISKENILMNIVPTQELGDKLGELSKKIRSLEKVDLRSFTEEVSKIIENNKENFLTLGLDVRETVANLLTTTLETEVVNMVRSFSIDIKRARGFTVYNRGKDELKEKTVDKEALKRKLEKIQSIVEGENFDIGMEHFNRYIKTNVRKFLKELE